MKNGAVVVVFFLFNIRLLTNYVFPHFHPASFKKESPAAPSRHSPSLKSLNTHEAAFAEQKETKLTQHTHMKY